jgi:IS5 family transposase
VVFLDLLRGKMLARVEPPSRVIKRQLGYMKALYRGLAKNGAQFQTLFALSNLWMSRDNLTIAG